MSLERTFAIIKPTPCRRPRGRDSRHRRAGRLPDSRATHDAPQRAAAQGFYAVHSQKPFFAGLVKFMTEGPIVVLALEREDAIRKWRETMGATNRPMPPRAPSASVSRPTSNVTRCTARMPLKPPKPSCASSSPPPICCSLGIGADPALRLCCLVGQRCRLPAAERSSPRPAVREAQPSEHIIVVPNQGTQFRLVIYWPHV